MSAGRRRSGKRRRRRDFYTAINTDGDKDGKSEHLLSITEAGLEAQRLGWQHQDKVAVAFADLPAANQERLLAISRDLTAIFRKRLASQSPAGDASCAPSRGMARALTRRRQA